MSRTETRYEVLVQTQEAGRRPLGKKACFRFMGPGRGREIAGYIRQPGGNGVVLLGREDLSHPRLPHCAPGGGTEAFFQGNTLYHAGLTGDFFRNVLERREGATAATNLFGRSFFFSLGGNVGLEKLGRRNSATPHPTDCGCFLRDFDAHRSGERGDRRIGSGGEARKLLYERTFRFFKKAHGGTG